MALPERRAPPQGMTEARPSGFVNVKENEKHIETVDQSRQDDPGAG
jgi:hypothetical protein